MQPFSYYDLLEALEKPGCALCQLLERDTRRYLDALLYEYSLDQTTQRAFRDRRGLCHRHSWLLLESLGHSANVAALYEAVLDELLKTLDALPGRGNASARLASVLPGRRSAGEDADPLKPSGVCLCCEAVAGDEAHYVRMVADGLGDARFRAAFDRSTGLCLPHFRRSLASIRDANDTRTLIEAQRAVWRKLQAELDAFMAKSGVRGGGAAMGDERDSWRRVIALVAGGRDAFGDDNPR